MAGKSVNFNAHCNLRDSYIEEISKWLSCNGEVWGVGPTAVFAAAAALFLHHELEAAVFVAGDHPHVSLLEKTLLSSMVLGVLALMVHVWVCLMRFFQYYLDTLIRDSPNVLLEMTTAGLLGAGQSELVALGPLTRFLRQQQPQIHITMCWFLSLCYADYIRKHYCTRFNTPYLEQWLSGTARQKRSKASLGVVGSHVSWGDRIGGSCEATLVDGVEVALNDVAAVYDATGETIKKLRAYIKATQCSCSSAPDARVRSPAEAAAVPAADVRPVDPDRNVCVHPLCTRATSQCSVAAGRALAPEPAPAPVPVPVERRRSNLL